MLMPKSRNYTDLYVSNSGVITFGEPYWSPNMQAATARTPAIFPLLIELDTRQKSGDGGVYVRQTPYQLVVTWYHVPALYQPQAIYTFQAVLNTDGSFEFTTNGLPLPIIFDPDATPSADPWLRGAVSGRGEPLHTNAADLLTTAQTGGLPLIENFQLAFRRYLHRFMLPLAGAVVGGSLLLMLLLPLLLRFSIIRPLEVLTGGVRQMEAGDLSITLPVRNQDEIGYLTGAFNALAAQLGDLIGNLEARVITRTFQLDAANTQLRAEIDQREAAQAQLLVQQRTLAAVEERERFGPRVARWAGPDDGLHQRAVAGRANPVSRGSNGRGAHQLAADNPGRAGRPGRHPQLHPGTAQPGRRSRRPAPDPGGVPAPVHQDPRHPGRLELSGRPALRPLCAGRRRAGLAHRARGADQRPQARQRDAVEVIFSFTGDQAQVIISDDGVGFDPTPLSLRGAPFATKQSLASDEIASAQTTGLAMTPQEAQGIGHFGLSIMRERDAQVGGSLEVRAAPGQGTRVLLTLPCATSAPDEVDRTREMRVLLVDDHPLFLDGLRNLLIARGVSVIGLASDGLQAQAQAIALRPNLIVMDLEMPRCNGLEAVRAIKAQLPEIKIVMLTMSEDANNLFEAIKAGAADYLLKSLDAGEFVKLLAGVMRGEAPLPPALAARLVAEFAAPRPSGENPPLVPPASHPLFVPPGREEGGAPADLTPRQWEILQLVAGGMTYKEVGVALHLSEDGVKYHMGRILDLLHLANREQAIAFARQHGDTVTG